MKKVEVVKKVHVPTKVVPHPKVVEKHVTTKSKIEVKKTSVKERL